MGVAIVILGLLLAVLLLAQWQVAGRVQRLAAVRLPEPFRETAFSSVQFQLLSGRLQAGPIRVPNPDGFTLPDMIRIDGLSASIAWPGVLWRMLNIRMLEISQITLYLERDAAGRWNLPWLPQPEPVAPRIPVPAPEMPLPEVPPAPPVPLDDIPPPPRPARLRLRIGQAQAPVRIVLLDHLQPDEALRMFTFEGELFVEDIFTYGDLPPEAWGELALTGAAVNSAAPFETDIVVRLAPMPHLERISLQLDGRIRGGKLDLLPEWPEKLGLQCASLDLESHLQIQEGRFRRESVLHLTAHDGVLTGAAARSGRTVQLPSVFTVRLPVTGTVQNPEIPFAQAITESILRHVSENPEGFLDQIRIDGKSLRDRLRL